MPAVTFLQTGEDLKWLREVHVKGRATGFRYAIIHGTEDCPRRIELYRRNHYQCRPTVLEPDEDGEMRVTQKGE